MRKLPFLILLAFVAGGSAHASNYHDTFGEDPAYDEETNKILNALDFKHGKVEISAAHATLNIPQEFYYLDGNDTARVLRDLWGNPPEVSEGTMGMVFPSHYRPEDSRAWGSVLDYASDGYVSDEDADSVDYQELLGQLQESTREASKERVKNGYQPIELVGWASQPYYDHKTHALHWARDLKFGSGSDADHTLNYQLRMLGREGVLELNFVAGLDQLDDIRTNIPKAISMVSYNEGKKYSDFREGDKLAAYGLAGLIAAGAGAKIAAKVGFLAIALAFLKKGFIVVIALFGGVVGWVKRLFSRKAS